MPVVKEYQRLAAKVGLIDYNFSALEGFLVAEVMVDGLKRSGRSLTRERFIEGRMTSNGQTRTFGG